MTEIDKRTGRPFGDHGTAMQAIEFALDRLDVERDTFLKSWREGDLDEWPEFYVWLSKQTPSPETNTEECEPSIYGSDFPAANVRQILDDIEAEHEADAYLKAFRDKELYPSPETREVG